MPKIYNTGTTVLVGESHAIISRHMMLKQPTREKCVVLFNWVVTFQLADYNQAVGKLQIKIIHDLLFKPCGNRKLGGKRKE